MEHRAPCKHIFCPNRHPRPLGLGQKVTNNFFLKVVRLHIKLKGMEHSAPWKNIFCLYTHTWLAPGVVSKCLNIFFGKLSCCISN